MARNLLPILIWCSIFLASCTAARNQAELQPAEEEAADLSCSYFYFLWGTHAEFNEHFPEALEAYEKALICDTQAEYVKEKLPVLLLKMGEFERAANWLAEAIDDHPENNTYRLFLANLYVQQEKVEEAIKLYYEVLEKEPDNEGVQLRLGLLYSHMERYDTAEKIFKQMLEKNPQSYFTHLSLARLFKQTKQYKEAIREYEKALVLNWSKDLAYELGHIFASQELYIDALRVYTTITENDQFDERAALSRIQILLDLERSDQALKELKVTRNHSKNPANIDLIISKILLHNNDVEKARDILDRLTRETDNPEPHYMLALLAYQEEDYENALEHLTYIGADSKEFEESVYLQTRIYQKKEELDKAITLLRKHISMEDSRSPHFYALLSSLYQEKGDNLPAISLMETAVTLYPDNIQLFFEYGLLLEKNGMYEQAVNSMERVLELQPEHAEALNFIGYTWADNNINLELALQYIIRATELKPDNGFIIDSLGWVYYRLGHLKKAAKELEHALELEPDDPHIYEHLGDVYRTQRKFPEALEVYQKAYGMFLNNHKKANIKSKIDALESR